MIVLENTEAIYARQSIDKKDSLSIDTQIEKCKALTSDSNACKIYIDKGFSGKNTNRPGFKDLMDDIKDGKINKVIVYKLDRLSRSTLDFGLLMNEFKKYDVSFHSISETFDTSTPMGNAMLQIVMVFAELERSTIASRVKDNYYERGKRGLFLGGPAPYGFDIVREVGCDGKKFSNLKINDKEALIVSEVFSIYSRYENTPLSCVSEEIKERYFKLDGNVSWDSSRISKILRNPCYVKADADVYTYFKGKNFDVKNEVLDYTGEFSCISYGKRNASSRRYTDENVISISRHKGFIRSEVWLKCQRKLDLNNQIPNGRKGSHSWLTGLVKCGKCGYSMSVSKCKNYKYFVCRGKNSKKKCDGQSTTHYVNVIENYIEKELVKKIELLPDLNLMAKPKNLVKDNKVAMKIIQIDEKIQNIVNSITMLDGEAIDVLGDKINELSLEKAKLVNFISTHEKTENIDNSFDIVYRIKEDFSIASFEEKKILAKILIDKIYIKESEIEIIWNI